MVEVRVRFEPLPHETVQFFAETPHDGNAVTLSVLHHCPLSIPRGHYFSAGPGWLSPKIVQIGLDPSVVDLSGNESPIVDHQKEMPHVPRGREIRALHRRQLAAEGGAGDDRAQDLDHGR